MLTPIDGRTEKGTFAPGNQLAPKRAPYQYAARALYLQESMTAEEILALNNDDKALGKRPAIDTIVIRRLARAMKKMDPETCSDVDRAAENHFDRVEGKPLQGLQHSGMVVSASVSLDEGQKQDLAEACKRYIAKTGG